MSWLRSRPMIGVFCVVALGVVVCEFVHDVWGEAADVWLAPWLVFVCAGVLGVVGAFVRARVWRTWVYGLAGVCFGAAWAGVQLHHVGSGQLALGADEQLVHVEGVLTGNVTTSTTQRGALASYARFDQTRTRFEVSLRSVIDGSGAVKLASGKLRVNVVGDVAGVGDGVVARAGDRVRVLGWGRRVGEQRNPGGFDAQRWAAQNNVVGWLRVSDPELVGIVEHPGVFERVRALPARVVGHVRARAAVVIGEDGGEAASLLRALLLGQRDAQLEETYDVFARQGVAHLLAVSGLHLGVMAVMVAWLVRMTGDRPRLEAALVLGLVVFAMVLVPARPPIVRAGLIVVGWVVADRFGRRYDQLNMLALVAVVVLLWKPGELMGAGYQLSFAVVAALMTLTTPLRERLFGSRENEAGLVGWAWFIHRVQDAVSASLAAWLVATPIVVAHTGVVSFLAPVNTIVLTPVVGLILGLGYASVLVAQVSPSLGSVCAPALEVLAGWLGRLVDVIDQASWTSLQLAPVDGVWPIAAAVCVSLLIGLHARKRWVVGCGVVLVVWAGVSGHVLWRVPSDVAVRIDTLDVGDGTTHLVRAGGDAVLVDCGSTQLSVGLSLIPDALRAMGVTRVHTVLVSHPDIDHYAGLVDMAKPLGVREVLTGERFMHRATSYAESPEAFTRAALERMGVVVRQVEVGEVVRVGDVSMTLVGPATDALDATVKDNDASLVWLLETKTEGGVRTALFTSDIEQRGMAWLRLAQPALEVDVLELPHHGSARDFAYPFVRWLDPGVVIQSTGRQRLDDPRWDSVRRGRVWRVTARDGAVRTDVLTSGEILTRGWRDAD